MCAMDDTDFWVCYALADRVLGRPDVEFFTAEAFADVVREVEGVALFALLQNAKNSPFRGAVVGYLIVDAANGDGFSDYIEGDNFAFAVWLVPGGDGTVALGAADTVRAVVAAVERLGYAVEV